GGLGRFGGPGESLVGEADAPACAEQWPEQSGYGLALGDRVRGDEREAPTARIFEVVGGLLVPASHIIQVSVIVLSPNRLEIARLIDGLGLVPDEGRVANDHDLRRRCED